MLPRLILALMLCAWAPTAVAQVFGQPSCTVQGEDVNFGFYDPGASQPTDVTGGVILRCTCSGNNCGAIRYIVELGNGLRGNREMSGNGHPQVLRYQLYSDPQRTDIFGRGREGVSGIYIPPLFGLAREIPVYARLPAHQSVPADTYSDLADITIRF